MPELTKAEEEILDSLFGPKSLPKQEVKPEPKKQPEPGSDEAVIQSILNSL